MDNPIKMDDLGVPLFQETSICEYTIIYIHIHYTNKSIDYTRQRLYIVAQKLGGKHRPKILVPVKYEGRGAQTLSYMIATFAG